MTDYSSIHVAWLKGQPIAMLHDLDDGTIVRFHADDTTWPVGDCAPDCANSAVIVVAWPDGSKPEPPVKPDMEWLRGMVAAYELAMSQTDGRDDDWLAPRAARYRAVLDYIDSIGGEG